MSNPEDATSQAICRRANILLADLRTQHERYDALAKGNAPPRSTVLSKLLISTFSRHVRAMIKDIHVFLNDLRTRDPLLLEKEALELEDDPRQLHQLISAAERFFSPASCRQLAGGVACGSASAQTIKLLRDYWREVCEWLPEHPGEGSNEDLFYEAQRMESAGDKEMAYNLYLRASETHPLAAASAARLGGRSRRLEGWVRYKGPTDSRVVAGLQCLAIMMHLLRISYVSEAPLSAEEQNEPIAEEDWQLGLLAGRAAVCLGWTEPAIFLIELLGKPGFAAALDVLILASSRNIHAAAYLRALQQERQKPAPFMEVGEVPYDYHAPLFDAEGYWISLPWKGLPFCYAPYPGLYFFKTRVHTLAMSVPVLRTLTMRAPLRVDALKISFDPLRLDYDPTVDPLHGPGEIYTADYLSENVDRGGNKHLMVSLQRREPEVLSLSLNATYSLSQAREQVAATATAAAAAGETPSGALKDRPKSVVLYSTHIVTRRPCVEKLIELWCRNFHPLYSYRGTPKSELSGEWAATKVKDYLTCDYLVCVQCPYVFDLGGVEAFKDQPHEMWHYPPPALSDTATALCESGIADPSARTFWKGALSAAVRTRDPEGVYFSLKQRDEDGTCTECHAKLAKQSASWSSADKPLSLCVACMMTHTAGTWGIDMRGFYYYVAMMLDGPPKIVKTIDHTDRCVHWGRLAIEYLARQVSTPCITTAQWAQVAARFGPIQKSFTELLPPMMWLGSQPWFYGEMTSTEAEATLKANSASHGWWLMRYSSSEVGGLAFTVVESDGRTRHYRVSRGTGGEYIVRLKGRDERFAGLREMVAGALTLLTLTRPLDKSDLRVGQPRWLSKEQFSETNVMFVLLYASQWPLHAM